MLASGDADIIRQISSERQDLSDQNEIIIKVVRFAEQTGHGVLF